ncbi:MAG: sigma-54-dependent Fis family transcriptional regulator [Candidatus Wallbacteria bacterium]|nr:sigma-54-dependent Fis family transcriptional regulator [Candidatus Wallbacteria bacterium]
MSPPAPGASLSVLVVDDERNIRKTLRICLEELGCRVAEAAGGRAALAAASEQNVDLALVDLRLGDESGLDLLPELAAACPGAEILVITAYATVDSAVSAMKRGATDYLPKPFTPAQIGHLVARAAERRRLRLELADLEAQLGDAAPAVDLETASPAMRRVLETIERAADHDVAVLLRGESGTGKTVLARLLHQRSRRSARPFVLVNCPTLSEELLASELFGHARGAFTGAVRDQPGKVEAADGGTLFLDEIGELSPGLQAKLLRFLQDRQFERVGETRTRQADVRVVAATNRDLDADVATGRFRRDLLYRLNTVELTVPTLAERPEDVLALAQRFAAFFARASRRPPPRFSPEAEAKLLAHDWPGNVRELRNAVERAVIFCCGGVLEPGDLPERLAGAGPAAPHVGGEFSLEAVEQAHIARVVARCETLEQAASILGIDSSTLWRKRRKLER